MKGKRFLGSILATSMVLVLLAGLSMAQEPAGSPAGAVPSAALGTGFTYQGQLKSGGTPYSGDCDLQFGLWDASLNGNQLGTQTVTNVPLADGYFTVQLDYGEGIFLGDARWLDISVRCPAGGGTYTPLTPRQALTPTPHALALPGLWTQQNGTSPNLIGGYSGNWTTSGVYGATIGGGGQSDALNRVTDRLGTVGGGYDNQAGDDAGSTDDAHSATVGGGGENTAQADFATVSGGRANTADGWGAVVAGGGDNIAGGNGATIGGGYGNTVSTDGATIGGGYDNTASGQSAVIGGGNQNVATGENGTIGGGNQNVASQTNDTVGGGTRNTASGSHATVGGGADNNAAGWGAVVAGGYLNTASGAHATIGGGREVTASGYVATVPGGYDVIAQGDYSFAAGRHANAYNQGCFVWGDATDADVACNDDNRWVARASGGVYFYTNSGLSSGVYVPAGGNAWSTVSDRNLKENVAAVDEQEVLARLAQVPISTWNYESQDAAIRHMGPMAQDFYGAFGLGEDDTHISTVDADGVALAAIQGLYAQVQDKAARITALESANAAQQQQIDALELRLAALEGAASGGQATRPWQVGLLPGAGLLLVGLTWVARKEGRR